MYLNKNIETKMSKPKNPIRYVIRCIGHNIVKLFYDVVKIDEEHYFVWNDNVVYLCCNKEKDFEELHEYVDYRTCIVCGEKLDLTQ